MAFDGGNQISVGAKPQAMPADAELGQFLEARAQEAQEQITHHSVELAMWERVRSSVHAGLERLASEPQAGFDVESASEPRY